MDILATITERKIKEAMARGGELDAGRTPRQAGD